MRKILNKIIVFLLLAVLTACNDWLNVSPKTDMKAEDLFSTEAGFRDALVGVYALMCQEISYGKNLSYGYVDILAQYYSSPRKNTSSGYPHNYKYVAEYNYTESGEESRILSIWKNHYAAIANINQALSFIDGNIAVFSTPEIHDIYKGEFLALRAMFHFDILRLFASSPVMDNGGGLNTMAIPYIDSYTNIAQNQLSVQEVLQRVEKDLLDAQALMKGKEDFKVNDSSSPQYNRKQRMNYYAATALLARVYLYGNQKGKALLQAKEVIGEPQDEKPTKYALASGSATTADPMFSTELIFTLDVQKLKDLSENCFSETSPGTVLNMTDQERKSIFNTSELDQEFRAIWLTTLSDGVSAVLNKYKGMKYIPMFKISELYLIAAECAGGSDGMAYLNELRNHRGLRSVTDSEKLDEFIYQEYRREFIGEGQLFFYYKRKGFDRIGAMDNVAIENRNAVYNLPIPITEIDFGNIKK